MNAHESASTYTHYAFISYSRRDEKHAHWLHKALENFRIPTGLPLPEHLNSRKPRVRPLFRDQTDLDATPGRFEADIKRALEQSRYLIVLCSPNAARSKPDGRHWIDEEILYFIEHHGREKALPRILPIIIAGRPDSEDPDEGCLPPALRELGDEILDRNLPTLTRSAANGTATREDREELLVTCIAFLLGVSRSTISDRFQQAERARMRRWAALGVSVCLLMAGLTGWALVERTEARQQRTMAEESLTSAVLARNTAVEALVASLNSFDDLAKRYPETQSARLKAIHYADAKLSEIQGLWKLKNPNGAEIAEFGAKLMPRLKLAELYGDLDHYGKQADVRFQILKDLDVIKNSSPEIESISTFETYILYMLDGALKEAGDEATRKLIAKRLPSFGEINVLNVAELGENVRLVLLMTIAWELDDLSFLEIGAIDQRTVSRLMLLETLAASLNDTEGYPMRAIRLCALSYLTVYYLEQGDIGKANEYHKSSSGEVAILQNAADQDSYEVIMAALAWRIADIALKLKVGEKEQGISLVLELVSFLDVIASRPDIEKEELLKDQLYLTTLAVSSDPETPENKALLLQARNFALSGLLMDGDDNLAHAPEFFDGVILWLDALLALHQQNENVYGYTGGALGNGLAGLALHYHIALLRTKDDVERTKIVALQKKIEEFVEISFSFIGKTATSSQDFYGLYALANRLERDSEVREITTELRRRNPDFARSGLVFTDVFKEGNAERSGIKVGDILAAVNGKPCYSLLDWLVLNLDEENSTRELTLIRNKEEISVKVQPGMLGARWDQRMITINELERMPKSD